MRKLIKVIAVPVLCCIILLFFMVDFHSHGEEVSAPRATDVKKTEPAIAVWQEEKEVVPIAIEETEELTEIIEEMSKEDVELIALVTMAEAEGECEDELIDVRFEKIFVGSFMKNWNQEQIMTLCSLLLVSIVHTVFLCFRLEIIIFQDTSKERRIIMRNFLAVVSYTLAAMSGICFAGGIAILSAGKGH